MKTLSKIILVSAISAVAGSAIAANDNVDCGDMNNLSSLAYWAEPSMLIACAISDEATASAGSIDADGALNKQRLSEFAGDEADEEQRQLMARNMVDDTLSELGVILPDAEGQLIGYRADFVVSRPVNGGPEWKPKGLGSVAIGLSGEGANKAIRLTKFNAAGQPQGQENWPDPNARDSGFERGSDANGPEGNRVTVPLYIWQKSSGGDNNERFDAIGLSGVSYSKEGQYKALRDTWRGAFVKEHTDEPLLAATFTVGHLTPLQDIESMMAGAVTATYRGMSSLYRQSIALNVNFREKAFTAQVGDVDRNMNARRDLLGEANKDRDMSFSAKGTISGAHLISRDLTADDARISGVMQGSFVGAQAEGVIGAYDVTKDGVRINDTYVTAKDGENMNEPSFF